jgi:hypothetical protein
MIVIWYFRYNMRCIYNDGSKYLDIISRTWTNFEGDILEAMLPGLIMERTMLTSGSS